MTIGNELAASAQPLAEHWLAPDRLFDGRSIIGGQAVLISGERISAVLPESEAVRHGAPIWRTPGVLAPGYFDIQINGGGGVLFNDSPTVEGLAAIGETHRRLGTTSWMPTLITDTVEKMERAGEATLDARGRFGVVGLHYEGPHISKVRKGTHKESLIRPIDERSFALFELLRERGLTLMVTLAPECNPPGTISRLVKMGVVVSIGHSAADAANVHAALAEGATAFTHLHNAMTPMTSREPGVVGAALDSDAYCGFIADCHHVAAETLRVSIRARKSPGRMVVVSDAMPTVGGPDTFQLYGETIRVADGVLVNPAGSLAGAHIDMQQSVCILVTRVGIAPESALRMATSAPADLLGLSPGVGSIQSGAQANLILLSDSYGVRSVILNGSAL